MNRTRLLSSLICLFISAVMVAVSASAQSLNRISPFISQMDSPNAAPQEGNVNVHTLVGIIGMGRKTRVGIVNTQTNKSVWVPLGGDIDGIEALSHDPRTDIVTVRINGVVETLRLRMPSIGETQLTPTTMALPTMPLAQQIPLKPLTNQAEQEREARMLVSDLMEIGMQQRKAYEQAQQKKGVPPARGPVILPPIRR